MRYLGEAAVVLFIIAPVAAFLILCAEMDNRDRALAVCHANLEKLEN